jgi:hypothetical protein
MCTTVSDARELNHLVYALPAAISARIGPGIHETQRIGNAAPESETPSLQTPIQIPFLSFFYRYLFHIGNIIMVFFHSSQG